MESPIPVDKIPRADAVEAARKFVALGDLMHIQDQWNSKGSADFWLSRAEFKLVCKVLYVGIGELSK